MFFLKNQRKRYICGERGTASLVVKDFPFQRLNSLCSNSLVLVGGQSQTELCWTFYDCTVFFLSVFIFWSAYGLIPVGYAVAPATGRAKGVVSLSPSSSADIKLHINARFYTSGTSTASTRIRRHLCVIFFLSFFSNEWSTERLTSCGIRGKKNPKSRDAYIQVAILKGHDTHSCTDSFYLVRYTFQRSKLDWIWNNIISLFTS